MRVKRAALAAVLVAIALVLPTAPAMAQGGGSETITPSGGCFSGTYSYGTIQSGVYRAHASTGFNGSCWGINYPGARAIGGSAVSAWGYNIAYVTVSVVKSTPSALAYGNHTINNGYARNT